MGTTSGRKDTSVADQLFDADESAGFSFFQAVRLLETLASRTSTLSRRGDTPSVGEDTRPDEEPVRFEVLQSLSFPSSEIVSLEPRSSQSPEKKPGESSAKSPDDRIPAVMETAFMGLTGPNGALPHHYTSLVIDRVRKNDLTLKKFWDLFNHRAISLFYRAWRKYRLAFAYEKHRQTSQREETDNYTQLLLALCGLGTPGLSGRQLVDDETYIYYSGHFASDHRSADGLRCLLTDAFNVPVEIEQFRGEWLPLSPEYQSCLPGARTLGRNTELGQETVVGSRVWSCQHRFRVLIGPVNHQRFQQFLPNQQTFRAMCQLVRSYVGIDFDFDVQVILHRDEVPPTQLGNRNCGGGRLGWNAWMRSPRQRDHANEATFRYDGIPTNGRETANQ